MMRFRHVVALVAAATLVGGAAASDVANAASSSGPGKSHVLTTGSASWLLDTVVPLTGSPQDLVYSQRTLQTAQLVNPLAPSQRPSLLVRSKAGKITNLGPLPSPALTGWSMSGNTVTATRGSEVFVYSASTGVHHTVKLVTGARYVSAAPGGFLYGVGAALSRHNASGADTSLGDPLEHADVLFGASSAAGAVLTDGGGEATYLTFSDPTHPVTLNPSGADGLGGADSCEAVTATAAGCIGGAPAAVYVPLNGSQATDDTDVDFDIGAVALAGDVLLFTESPDDAANSPIYSFKAGSSTAATSTGTYQNPYDTALVTAYGEAIATPSLVAPKPRLGLYQPPAPVVAAKSATQVSRLFSGPRSPVTAAAFSLTNGRVVYTADPVVAAPSKALVTVLSRRLTTHPGSVSVSAPTAVPGQAGSGISTSLLVATSAVATVYAHGTVDQGTVAPSLRVISPHHGALIHGLNVNSLNGVVALSGKRLLYSPRGGTYTVYNVKTGHGKVVHSAKKTVDRVALSGHYLAYASEHGAIFRENLLSGKTVQLAKPRPSYSGAVAVYQSGNWVGWEYGRSRGASWLRNAATMAKPIHLAHSLYSLTPAGALLDTTDTAEFNRGPIGVSRTKTWLRSYSGHTKTLLSARAFDQGPQISGGVLAWISAAGVLKVARLTS
jgi:hypothetical protein